VCLEALWLGHDISVIYRRLIFLQYFDIQGHVWIEELIYIYNYSFKFTNLTSNYFIPLFFFFFFFQVWKWLDYGDYL
jgi:hypothetical protein